MKCKEPYATLLLCLQLIIKGMFSNCLAKFSLLLPLLRVVNENHMLTDWNMASHQVTQQLASDPTHLQLSLLLPTKEQADCQGYE